jgi:hypothetical protein
MMVPYIEKVINERTVKRTFSGDSDVNDLVWHRDNETRLVEILYSDGWHFQYDDEFPFLLLEGMMLKIKKGVFHRVIKGYDCGKLEIKIHRFDT